LYCSLHLFRGAEDPRLGNNPIVFGFPREKGDLIADMAMSQFTCGALEVAVLKGNGPGASA
jgi:3-dehydro-L-gulonate 2-dehydrogenase